MLEAILLYIPVFIVLALVAYITRELKPWFKFPIGAFVGMILAIIHSNLAHGYEELKQVPMIGLTFFNIGVNIYAYIIFMDRMPISASEKQDKDSRPVILLSDDILTISKESNFLLTITTHQGDIYHSSSKSEPATNLTSLPVGGHFVVQNRTLAKLISVDMTNNTVSIQIEPGYEYKVTSFNK